MVLEPRARFGLSPLTRLPVTTACLECDGTIVAANRRFLRLFAMERSNRPAHTLTDIHRADVTACTAGGRTKHVGAARE